MEKPFWEQTYRDDTVSTFAKRPTVDIAEYWTLFPTGGSVLDVGCGGIHHQHAHERIIARKAR